MLTPQLKEVLLKNPFALQFLSPEEKDDYEVVKFAISINAHVIGHASFRLRGMKELFLYAVNFDHGKGIFNYATRELKNDKEFIIEMIKLDQLTIKSTPKNYLKDPDVIKVIYTCSGSGPNGIIVERPKNQRNNYELARAAAEGNGISLKDYDPELLNNIELAKLASAKNGQIYKYFNITNKSNYEIAKLSFMNFGKALKYAPDELKKDIELVKIACKNDITAIDYAHDDILNDFKLLTVIISEAIPNAGSNLSVNWYPSFIRLAAKLDIDWENYDFHSDLSRMFYKHYLNIDIINSKLLHVIDRIHLYGKSNKIPMYAATWVEYSIDGKPILKTGFIAQRYIFVGFGETAEEARLELINVIDTSPLRVYSSGNVSLTIRNPEALTPEKLSTVPWIQAPKRAYKISPTSKKRGRKPKKTSTDNNG